MSTATTGSRQETREADQGRSQALENLIGRSSSGGESEERGVEEQEAKEREQEGYERTSRSQPSQEHIEAQAAQAEYLIAIDKKTGKAYEARRIQDGFAIRELDREDQAYTLRRSSEFGLRHKIFRIMDDEEWHDHSRALAVSVLQMSAQARRITDLQNFISRVYNRLGNRGKAKMRDEAEMFEKSAASPIVSRKFQIGSNSS